MKTILKGALIALGGLAAVGVALAFVRPDLLPAWARPRAASVTSEPPLQCKEHGVPEKFCTLCHKELKSSLTLCKEHGNIPEDICTLCHPELKEKYDITMCPKGHGLPRDFCFKCGTNPSASAAPGEVPDVKLASAEIAKDIGIETAPATKEKRAPTLRANAETAYDARRYAEIRPRVSGFLSEVKADLGDAVRKGEVLAVVDSAEVGAAKARYLSARAAVELAQATYDRTKSLAATGAVAARQELETQTALAEAQANLREATQRLKNLRFDDATLVRLAKMQDTSSLLVITAPIGGTVVALEAVAGEAVEPTTQIYALADTRSMWLWIDVYESDIDAVKAGQAVTFTVSGANPAVKATAFAGKVTWVGTEVDPMTRTTRVRAELANPDGRLRAHQFGRAEVQLGVEHEAVVVPREAVQRRYQDHLVFVALADGVYHPQRVRVRPAVRGDLIEVASGLQPGQRVVTTGAFLLKTETMKDALGAGCTDD
ncbi:MAG: hypothetical protein KatS3mg108_0643 [Isosphaeraceae bacterium]|jgi:cobalt-zinc-cadmium efflux system membrane fusion protein|nr:MAG: hypothetical protein KatS3mg108_0643 [Isosphaeraceae bacterium]